MRRRVIQFRSPWIFLGGILICITFLPFVNAKTNYPRTISVLKAAYSGQIQAFHTYMAYAEKANSENYPNIANLFVSFATRESTNARNFKNLLSELGAAVKEQRHLQIKVSSTKKNLKRATEVELKEIDKQYPEFIQKIEPEKCEAAIRNITYAWKAQKQHRDLIQKIRSGTGILFGLLAKKIEEKPAHYFVCQNCGSTLTKIPKDNCPICAGSVSNYKKIEKIF